ncbi:MAG: hypothetical protein CMO44_05285 [Verrucomicrobiales bacterium]|nr:hypothetical protein [Verrucomicrobiales bacterium]|tara:strand:- start:217 stop:918 length:702 start_codon:yes stop_codon:yes gene_type:complete
MARKEFNWVDIDKNKLPKTKGKRIDGFRFYDVDGKHYPSITTVLGVQKKEGLEKWRKAVGEEAANWEMARAARRGKSTHTLVEQYLANESPNIRDVLPLGLFRLMLPYLDQVDNIHLSEAIMYSHKYTIAGQVDCVAEYNGKLSVIDFKTANKERQESWIENYYIQTCAYALMYEEIYGKPIEQLVILMAGEDGTMRSFIKDKAEFVPKLQKSIEYFYKYYQELNKDKIKQDN